MVFRGEVKSVRAARGDGKHRTRTYRVVSDRVYQSSLVQPSVVVTARVGTRCAPPTLTKGTRYIFFVNENGARLMAMPATAEATPKHGDPAAASHRSTGVGSRSTSATLACSRCAAP